MTDRNPVVVDESFQIIFESNASVDGDPDFTPLHREFRILSTNTSSNMSISNGKITTTKQWQLTVLAKHTGKLVIPAIRFGKDKSERSSVSVTRGRAGNALHTGNRNIFLEVEAKPLLPYVQSQVIYKVRLFRSVATSNASLSEPAPGNTNAAIIERIGQDKSYETRRMGKRFVVVERIYAIFPQTSGRIHIKPVVFQGQESRQGSFFSFDPFGPQPRPVVLQSDPVILNVKAVPDTFTGRNWLPATNLTLSEKWSREPPVFKVGEPVTRTVTLTAAGLTASQLPELPAWTTSDFKQYPDQPALSDNQTGFGIEGKRVEKTAIIPNKAGDYVLPAITIPWWNLKSDQMEYVTIAEKKITVASIQQGSSRNTLNAPPQPMPAQSSPDVTAGRDDRTQPSSSATSIIDTLEQPQSRVWQWLSLGLACGWLVTLLIWWLTGRSKAEQTVEEDNAESVRRVMKQLKQACKENNAASAKDILLRWGKLVWSDNAPANIGDIGSRCGETLAREIRLLNNVLYNRKQTDWQGDRLWRLVADEQKEFSKKKKEKTGNLEPLYRI
ncbi:MAG: BatD family protein [Gammaproteobacteria bacterium]